MGFQSYSNTIVAEFLGWGSKFDKEKQESDNSLQPSGKLIGDSEFGKRKV